MSALNKPVTYDFTSGVFDRAHVQKVYETLKAIQTTSPGTGVFRVVWLNPTRTSTMQGREQSVAETLVHEFSDWTVAAQTKLVKIGVRVDFRCPAGYVSRDIRER